MCRIQSVVPNGGTFEGVTLLSPPTIERIFEEQADGIDVVLGAHLRFGIGYGLPVLDTLPYLPDRKICFWGGWGGSMVINDVDRHICFTYMMNQMAPGIIGGPTAEALITALYAMV